MPEKPVRRRLLRLLFVPVAAYLGVLLVLVAIERKLIFHPATAAQYWQEPSDSRIRDVTLTAKTGEQIHAWFLEKPGSTDAVLYAHGNAGNLSGRGRSLAAWADKLDASVLIYDYPGYGKSTGSPSEQSCYAASDAAWAWLTERYPPERITLVGVSLGGAMAVELARQHPHRALVLGKAFTSIPDMAQSQYPWLPVRYLVRTKFDNLAKIADCRGPLMVMHGRGDRLVPFAHGQALYDAHPGPKEMFVDDSEHQDGLSLEFLGRLKDFLSGR